MMKEPWRARVAPLITVLFPPASNVRKNTRWQVCKRASTKLLSGKINGGSRGPHSDLRGQLVTAPRRCWGQQCGGSVSGRESVRDTPYAPPTLPKKTGWEVGECLPRVTFVWLRRAFIQLFPQRCRRKFRNGWSSRRQRGWTSYFKSVRRVVVCMCIIMEWKQATSTGDMEQI